MDHGATHQTFWLANSSSLCVFSIAWSHQLHSTEMMSSSFGWDFTVLASRQRSPGFTNFGKAVEKASFTYCQPSFFFISGKENELKWCYKAYLFMQTLFLSFSRQDVGTTLEIGGKCHMFPFLSSLPANSELRLSSGFSALILLLLCGVAMKTIEVSN